MYRRYCSCAEVCRVPCPCPAELLLQYATSDAANYMGYGTQRGMISLDVVSGKVIEVRIACI
jgi:hypothetical protein